MNVSFILNGMVTYGYLSFDFVYCGLGGVWLDIVFRIQPRWLVSRV